MIRLLRALRRLLPLLPPSTRWFLLGFAAASSVLAVVDILALSLLALTLAPMIQGNPVQLPLLGAVPPERYAWLLGGICALVVVKGLATMALQWAVAKRLAAYDLVIGDRLFGAYIRAPWTERLRRNTSQLVRLADVGIANTTTGLLLPAASLPAELATFGAVLVVLLVAQPLTALVTFAYLGGLAVLMYVVISPRAVVAGRVGRDYSFKVAGLMTEMMGALKEVTLRGKASEVAAEVHANRVHATRARSHLMFLNTVPKFVTDTGLVLGFAVVGGAAYLLGGADQAFEAVALFAVAGMRMIPSVNRFQSIITQTASTLPHAEAVITDIQDAQGYVAAAEQLGTEPLPDEPRLLALRDVAFFYPGAPEPAVHDLDLDIPLGSSVALVGASGAGKSTLVDLLLGLLTPSAGEIRVDERPLPEVLGAWRSRVGYVPQEVNLFDGTIAQNVALTWGEDIDEAAVTQALERAQLMDVVTERGGLRVRVAERGLALSGGQRQRLGIARALYADPLVLVLDEATSALDTATEDAVATAIRDLHGQVTVIAVAHRLSTVRHSDQVCFMKDGTIVARGDFEQVVAAHPEFATQARLSGLA
ncbi:Phospholipid-lipopolysaccharide ABC transporter [Serinicoccus hydrothermalis]|uniref:Phospholipid-lipopolysaccharide ABC transporter n=1 Tax=Serinicoccus hydrothermalis TaxID=1758689 RepID=A0A1B1N930_9MICO|nr:ABC transporter ATP-binding protein [Serinicoccus hydrothermalis]ANS77942.1 Phospholipid-lipopolysaccharide ABC transporter [Serinicoccus hydrothermalis]